MGSAKEQTPFTIKNLPYGVVSSKDNPAKRCATVLEDHAIDLSVLYTEGVFSAVHGLEQNVFDREYLNAFAALPRSTRQEVRKVLAESLVAGHSHLPKSALIPLADVVNHFPMDTRNFTDFYCSLEHTSNCSVAAQGRINISPSWFAAPMAYNGRTSSLVVSGTSFKRPCGVFAAPAPPLFISPSPPPSSSSSPAKPKPRLQPEVAMDFELEMGVFLSEPVARGERLTLGGAAAADNAYDKIFGMVLLNDWSARATQIFEMGSALGPFHGKGSATSISPWIVPLEALQQAAAPRHQDVIEAKKKKLQEEEGEEELGEGRLEALEHLQSKAEEEEQATFDVELTVKIIRDGKTYTVTESNLAELYWTPFQQLAHLSSAGEGLSTGDLFGTGTISSARTNEAGEKTGLGCLFERKVPANKLSSAPEGIAETFLLDGDQVVFEGWCRDSETKEVLFGFGKCEGQVLPAQVP